METVRLHGFWRSLASHRVRVALALKDIPFEEMEVDLLAGQQFAADFANHTRQHAVPVLEIDGRILGQSSAIIEYLDETRPSPPLLPADPADRARTRAIAMITVADSHPLVVPRIRRYLHNEIGLDEPRVVAWIKHWFGLGLDAFERVLAEAPPSPFVGGSAPGLADIAIGSHLVGCELFGLAVGERPVVAALAEALRQHPAFVDAHPLKRRAVAEQKAAAT